MKQSEPTRRGSGLSPTDPELLAAPLVYIREEHMRERQICAVMDGLAAAVPLDRKAARTVLHFLNEELCMHMRDKLEDLFPLLIRRCTIEDAIERTIARIRIDIDAAKHLLPELRAALVRCLDDNADLSAEDSALLMHFADHVRHQLAVENAILLPMARVRLTQRDLQMLSQHMRARRGLPTISETTDAE